MPTRASDDEWAIVLRLLPKGWAHAGRAHGAIQRARGSLSEAASLLRLLLFHVAGAGGLRSTVEEARLAGLATVSDVALLKRLRSSSEWLAWLARGLAAEAREALPAVSGYRPRAVDSTTVQAPASKGTQWRLHFTLDLLSLACDWHELTDAHGSELLERVPVRAGDVLLGDRNFFRPAGVQAVRAAGGHVVVRLKWTHPRLVDPRGKRVYALSLARRTRVGRPRAFAADAASPSGAATQGRLVVLRLPAPIAERNRERLRKQARKKGKTPDPRSLEAAGYVMLWTSLPTAPFSADVVLEWYRFRWQVELAFKRLKQLLALGRLPHKDERAARGWIQAKVLLAMLLETLYRRAAAVSPWGYELRPDVAERLEVDARGAAIAASDARPRRAAPDPAARNAPRYAAVE